MNSCPSVSLRDWFQDPCGYQNLWILKSFSQPSVPASADTEGRLYTYINIQFIYNINIIHSILYMYYIICHI